MRKINDKKEILLQFNRLINEVICNYYLSTIYEEGKLMFNNERWDYFEIKNNKFIRPNGNPEYYASIRHWVKGYDLPFFASGIPASHWGVKNDLETFEVTKYVENVISNEYKKSNRLCLLYFPGSDPYELDYERMVLQGFEIYSELKDRCDILNKLLKEYAENPYEIELKNKNEIVGSSFIYEKLEGDKLIENKGSDDAIHITVKSYKDKQTLFDIKQEKDEDDLHFYVRIENGRETFEYSRKIETQEDFCKALEQTINALENYSEFYEQKDELKEILEKFN